MAMPVHFEAGRDSPPFFHSFIKYFLSAYSRVWRAMAKLHLHQQDTHNKGSRLRTQTPCLSGSCSVHFQPSPTVT